MTPAVPGALTEPGLVLYRGAPLSYFNGNRFCSEASVLWGRHLRRCAAGGVDAGPIANVNYSAAVMVRQLEQDLDGRGVQLAFAHVQADLRAGLDRHGLTQGIGSARLFETLQEALAAMRYKGK